MAGWPRFKGKQTTLRWICILIVQHETKNTLSSQNSSYSYAIFKLSSAPICTYAKTVAGMSWCMLDVCLSYGHRNFSKLQDWIVCAIMVCISLKTLYCCISVYYYSQFKYFSILLMRKTWPKHGDEVAVHTVCIVPCHLGFKLCPDY